MQRGEEQGGDLWQIISVTPVINTMTIHTTTIPMERGRL
jgi:hypothetical protein